MASPDSAAKSAAASATSAAASAQAAATALEETVNVFGLPTEAAAQKYNIENDPGVKAALSASTERAVGATFAVADYGSVGTADDGPTLNAAWTAARAAGGGVIQLEPGRTYSFTTPLDFSAGEGIEVRGGSPVGTRAQEATGTPSILRYTGTTTLPIKTYECTKIKFTGVQFQYSDPSFTGVLFGVGDPDIVGTTDSTGIEFDKCDFGGLASQAEIQAATAGAVYGADLLVDLTGTDTVTFYGCTFSSAKYAVGRTDANAPTFSHSPTFYSCKFLPTIHGGHVLNPDVNYLFVGCKIMGSINPGGGGTRTPAFVRCDPNNTIGAGLVGSLRAIGCQFSDCSTANTEAWIKYEGRHLHVEACHFTEGGVGSFVAKLTGTTESTSFVGNYIAQSSVIDFDSQICYGCTQVGNTVRQANTVHRANTPTQLRTYIQGGGYSVATDGGTILGGATTQALGFYGTVGAARGTAFVQNYSTADRTLSAWTPDVESTAYTAAADGEAKLADLNALRVAYENLRAHNEDLTQFVNALVDQLQSTGLIA